MDSSAEWQKCDTSQRSSLRPTGRALDEPLTDSTLQRRTPVRSLAASTVSSVLTYGPSTSFFFSQFPPRMESALSSYSRPPIRWTNAARRCEGETVPEGTLRCGRSR
jgi:hypothetical protein